MSASLPPTQAVPPAPSVIDAATTNAIKLAQNAPELLAGFQAANPALAAQFTGSLATYRNSALAPLVGAGVGYVALHAGISMCSATVTTGCWTPEFMGYVTDGVCMLLAVGAAAANHWWSKSPARALLSASPKPPA